MAATFAEFIAWPDREEIAVAELSALVVDPAIGALGLTGWTGTAGNANTYQLAFGNRTTAPAGFDTIYRRVTGARESGVELVERSSVALVNANAGSWFWDEAAALLHIRTTGAAVNPDTRSGVAARVTFYLAGAPVVLDRVGGQPSTGIYFAPYLAPGAGPTSTQEIDDVLAGQKTSTGGEIVVTNGHRAFYPLASLSGGYLWRNQRAVFKMGGRYRGQALPFSEYQTVATMVIEDMTPDEVECRFTLRPILQLGGVAAPVTPIFESEYPALGDGVRGTYKAILYGRAWTRPALTDTGGNGTWTVADRAFQALHAVHTVEAVAKSDGAVAWLAEGQDYTVDLTRCEVTITSDRFSHLTHVIRVEATGKRTGANGVTGARGYLSTFAEIVEDLLRVFAGATTADIDAASFAEAQLDARHELAVHLTEPRALASILSTVEDGAASLERSVHGTVQQNRTGQWSVRVWDPSYDAATLPTIRKEDLAAFAQTARPSRVYPVVRVNFAQDGRSGAWQIAEYINQAYADLLGVDDARALYTFLRNPGDAEVMAKRYERVARLGDRAYDFVERGALLALAAVGDRVIVQYAPAANAAGAFTVRAFTLTRLERGYAPRLAVAGQMTDVSQITNRAGRWKSTGAPNYATATAAARLLSGFFFGSSGAPSGFSASRYW